MTISQSLSCQVALADLLARHLAIQLDLPLLLDEIVTLLHEQFPLEGALFFLRVERGWKLVAARDAEGDSLVNRLAVVLGPNGEGKSPHTGSLLPVPTRHAPRPPTARLSAPGGRSVLPLTYNEQTLGLIDLYPVRPLSDEEEKLLESLSTPIATALWSAATQQGRATTQQSFTLLYTGLAEIAQAQDVQSVLQLIANFIQASGWRRVAVTLRDRMDFHVTQIASAGLTDREREFMLSSQDGTTWFERLGPSFDRFRQDDWYYIPARERNDRRPNGNGAANEEPYQEGSWHPLDMLYMPLRDQKGRPLGLIVLGDPEDQQVPTGERMRPIHLFVRNAALLLENRKLQWESERRLAATRTVQETAMLVSTSLRVEDIIQHLIDQLARRFGYPYVLAYLREGEHFALSSQVGYPEGSYPDVINEEVGVMGRAVRERTTQWVPDVSEDPDYVSALPEITSEITVPIMRGNRVVGLFNVEATGERALTQEDKELLETLGEQMSSAIANAQLFNEIQRHAVQLETASEVSRRVTSILNIDQLLSEVVELIQRNFNFYHVQIFMHDPETDGWLLREAAGEAAEKMKEVGYHHASEEGVVGQVGLTGMPILVPDVTRDPRYIANPYLPETRAQLAVPLRLGAQVFGVLDVQSDQPDGLTPNDQDILETLGNQIAVALNNAQLFNQLERQLEERERLYLASYAISGALDIQELLEAIMQPLAVPHMIRAGLLIPEQFTEANTPEALEVVAVWNPTSSPPLIPPGTHLRAKVMHSLRRMAIEHVQVVDDTETDERLDPATRAIALQIGGRSMALVPLRAGPRIPGWLLLMSKRKRGFDERLLKPFQTLADQAALAVERVRLLTQTQQRAERLAALNTLATNIISSLDLEKTLEDSVRAMAHLFRVRQSGLLLFEDNNTRARLMAQYREDGFRHEGPIIFPLVDNPLTEKMLATRKHVYVRDVSTDPLAVRIREAKHPRSYNALLVVPLLTRDRVIGSISLDVVEDHERVFEPEEIDLAETMAAQIASAIENARLYEEATHRAYDMETASQIGQLLTKLLSEEALIREIVHLICHRFRFYFTGIYLVDRGQPNRLELSEGASVNGETPLPRRHVLWLEQGLPGHVLREQRTLVANNVEADSHFSRLTRLPGTAAQASLPLVAAGQLLGVLDLHSERTGVFDSSRMAVLSTIADQIAIALQNVRLFAAQRDALARLQELDRLKSDFLASMSHELRTPLNSIIGFSKIILRGIDGPVTDAQKEDLTSIHNSGQHLLALINDVLDMSKITAGKMELKRRPLQLAEVIEETLITITPQAEERSLRLEYDIEEDLPPVWADRVRVHQVLLNLLSNAVKFTEKGGVFVTIRRVASPRPSDGKTQCVGDAQGKFVEVAVRDTGIGIKNEEQEVVFEEFRQLERSSNRRAGGTGLGLAISRRFVELHGGSLWLESRVGVGSTFRFSLPIVDESATTDEPATADE